MQRARATDQRLERLESWLRNIFEGLETGAVSSPAFHPEALRWTGGTPENPQITPLNGSEDRETIIAPRWQFLSQYIQKLDEYATLRHRQFIESEAIAAIPDWWQTRRGADRHQMILQFAATSGDKAPKYVISVPHPRSNSQSQNIPLTSYIKGNWMGILYLKDNSKLIVNCRNQAEARRVINTLKTLIDPAQIDTPPKITFSERNGAELQQIEVKLRIIKYFSQGQRNTKPDWVKYV